MGEFFLPWAKFFSEVYLLLGDFLGKILFTLGEFFSKSIYYWANFFRYLGEFFFKPSGHTGARVQRVEYCGFCLLKSSLSNEILRPDLFWEKKSPGVRFLNAAWFFCEKKLLKFYRNVYFFNALVLVVVLSVELDLQCVCFMKVKDL